MQRRPWRREASPYDAISALAPETSPFEATSTVARETSPFDATSAVSRETSTLRHDVGLGAANFTLRRNISRGAAKRQPYDATSTLALRTSVSRLRTDGTSIGTERRYASYDSPCSRTRSRSSN